MEGCAVVMALALACAAMGDGDPLTAAWSVEALKKSRTALEPLAAKINEPGPNDWLARHRETGQTFEEYLRCDPVKPEGRRRILYVRPIGEFTAQQQVVLRKTAEFLGLFYGVPVAINAALSASVIPPKARRVHPSWGDKQILTTYAMDEVLRPKLPADAAAVLAFTASDLWPGENWNFVFGQADLRDRVGVWSLYRFGNPDESPAAFTLCLRRTLKLAVHETGHMFSILHCTAYQCGMCGSNHLGETDQRPLHFCPECTVKVCWATQTDPVQHCARLRAFLESAGIRDEADFYRRAEEALVRARDGKQAIPPVKLRASQASHGPFRE
jgi:archaemetzincin